MSKTHSECGMVAQNPPAANVSNANMPKFIISSADMLLAGEVNERDVATVIRIFSRGRPEDPIEMLSGAEYSLWSASRVSVTNRAQSQFLVETTPALGQWCCRPLPGDLLRARLQSNRGRKNAFHCDRIPQEWPQARILRVRRKYLRRR